MKFRLGKILRHNLVRNLREFQSIECTEDGLTPAAVAIVIASTESSLNNPAILFTRRPVGLKQHPGQYALPGGKFDRGENANQAALRELYEELGLQLTEADIIGRLDDYPTRSQFCITPVVLWAGSGHRLQPSNEEVAEVFRIPFSELDSNAIPIFEPGQTRDRPILCSDFPTLGQRMYSPSASIMYQFREVAIRGIPTRVSHYDQPKFAWQ